MTLVVASLLPRAEETSSVHKGGVGDGAGGKIAKMAMLGPDNVPAFDGRGPIWNSRSGYIYGCGIRRRSSRAVHHFWYFICMRPHNKCPTARGDCIDNHDGVARILGIPRNYFPPEAADWRHQQVMRFMQLRCAEQPIDEFIAEFDSLSRKAESKTKMGAGLPEQFISKLRMNVAGLSRREKSLAMSSSQKSLKFDEVAANMRRLYGSRGGSGRRGVLITEEAVGPEGSGEDQDA